MYDLNQRHDDSQPSPATQTIANLQEFFRLVATVLGLAMMVIGLCFALKLFGEVNASLGQPGQFAEPIAKWEQALGGKELDVKAGDTTLRVSRILAIAALGGSVLVLIHVAVAFVYAGARIVSWTATDRQAIRRIILQAIGKPGAE